MLSGVGSGEGVGVSLGVGEVSGVGVCSGIGSGVISGVGVGVSEGAGVGSGVGSGVDSTPSSAFNSLSVTQVTPIQSLSVVISFVVSLSVIILATLNNPSSNTMWRESSNQVMRPLAMAEMLYVLVPRPALESRVAIDGIQ